VPADPPVPKERLDKWLWHARFFKTRSLASKKVGEGKIRVNQQPVTKPAFTVSPDDVLTFSQGDRVRVVRVRAIATRRGPAPEAQALYEDLSPPPPPKRPAPAQGANPRYDKAGRPTKKDRRDMDRD
jgi:ribosome-associated heat shock protein Hsp15